MFITPTIIKISAARAANTLSSNEAYNEITPRYKNSKTNSDVKRASHTHHVPHIGLPQVAPITRAIKVKTAPTGAIDAAIQSATLSFHIKPINAAQAIPIYATIDIEAEGTCTKIIR